MWLDRVSQKAASIVKISSWQTPFSVFYDVRAINGVVQLEIKVCNDVVVVPNHHCREWN